MKLEAGFETDIPALVGRLEEGVTTVLDPQDPADRSVIEAFLDLSNKRSDRFPALHAALASANSAPDGTDDDLRIVDAGRTPGGGRATACAWHAARGGAYISGAATLALDSESNEPLAFGAGTQVGGTRAVAATDSAAAGAAGQRVTALSFFHAQRTPDDPVRFGVTAASRPVLADNEFQINPVDPHGTHNPISIAVARAENQHCTTDTDYCYLNLAADQNNPLFLVPFTGTAVNLPSTITGIDPTSKNIAGLTVSTALYVNGSPQAMVPSADTASKLDAAVTGDTETTVSWSFPYDQHTPEGTNPGLRYGPAAQYNGSVFAFLFSFSVPVADPTLNPFGFNVCSQSWQHDPSEVCCVIPNLTIWWHCLAAGAEVTLEDGSTQLIEEVGNLTRVRTGLGGSLGVEATTRGLHPDGPGPLGGVLELETGRGRKLVLTALHPVMTRSGPVAARDLRPGDEVVTADGVDSVGRCDPSPYDGFFCNLKLVDRDDRARGASPLVGTFIANGIVVGDHLCQEAHWDATRHDLDYMQARLPEDTHTDYESALADIAPTR